MDQRILVINPNSTQAVTDFTDRAIEPLRMTGGPVVDCMTLAEGPPGLQSRLDDASVVQPLLRVLKKQEERTNAFVIACYSDPALAVAREATRRPVFGIAESAMVTACTLGDRFGVISSLDDSIPKHRQYIRTVGLESRFAGDLAIGIGITEITDDDTVVARLIEVGTRLRRDYGAGALIMGCAGMAPFRRRVEAAVGIPVVEPTQAAVTLAIGAVRLADET